MQKFAYKATHVSVVDGSDAMYVMSSERGMILTNEDGYMWIAEPGQWVSLHQQGKEPQ